MISLSVAVIIGVVGAAAMPELVDRAAVQSGAVSEAAAKSTAETIFIALATALGNHGVILALFAGVVLAGILAATMSTADSQLLAASSSVAQNFFKGIIHKKASEKLVMWVARGTVIVVAVIGALLALNPDSSVFDIVSFAWAGFGAAFGPVILFALFWKRTNFPGAFAGMVTGGAMVFIWKFGISRLGGIFAFYELLPAFILACVAIVVVSLLTKAPSEEIVEQFERAASKEPLE